MGLVDHIVFNSPRQVALYGEMARKRGVSVGLRVNPEVSVATTPAYDPCRPSSRLGTTRTVLDESGFFLAAKDAKSAKVDGLHFHCLCEQGLGELKKVLAGFEEKFGEFLPQMKWVNFGGGHHITREGYDIEGLVALLNDFISASLRSAASPRGGSKGGGGRRAGTRSPAGEDRAGGSRPEGGRL